MMILFLDDFGSFLQKPEDDWQQNRWFMGGLRFWIVGKWGCLWGWEFAVCELSGAWKLCLRLGEMVDFTVCGLELLGLLPYHFRILYGGKTYSCMS